MRAGLCYTVPPRAATATFYNARSACNVLGGDLVMYNSEEKQAFVEGYFASQGNLPKVSDTLPSLSSSRAGTHGRAAWGAAVAGARCRSGERGGRLLGRGGALRPLRVPDDCPPPLPPAPLQYYWQGIMRSKPGVPYTFVSGDVVGQTVSNNPYAHWSWNQPSYSLSSGAGASASGGQPPPPLHTGRLAPCKPARPGAPLQGARPNQGADLPWSPPPPPLRCPRPAGYNCILAWFDLAYDQFLGDPASATQQAARSMFQTASGHTKYAWTAYPCNTAYGYICEVASDNFACGPPPSPPNPPPSPPSPPAPPAPPTCERPARPSPAQPSRPQTAHAVRVQRPPPPQPPASPPRRCSPSPRRRAARQRHLLL